ncbi:MAG: hypothetical protein LIQ30_06915 [Planctomycetes bacterium]|nr:hypothetical protein [Planctomycetota bacterium]
MRRESMHILLLSLVVCLLTAAAAPAAQRTARRFGKQEAERKSYSLDDIMASPREYLERDVLFYCRFATTSNLFKNVNTRFNSTQHVNFAVWPDKAILWEESGRKNVLPTLYVAKNDPDTLEELRTVKKYELLAVTGRVLNVYAGYPWIQITKIERVEKPSERLCEQVIEHMQSGHEALRAEAGGAAARHYEQALTMGLPCEFRAKAYEQLAHAYLLDNRLDLARDYLRQAVELNRNDPILHLALADVTLRMGDAGEAIAHSQFALERSGKYPQAYGIMGEALSLLGDYAKAFSNLNTAAGTPGITPREKAMVNVRRARIYARSGREPDAARLYVALSEPGEILSGDPAIHAEIGLFYERMYLMTGEARYLDSALAAFEESARLGRVNPAMYYNAAEVEFRRVRLDGGEDFGKVVQLMDKVYQIEPDYAAARVLEGRLLYHLGNVEEAEFRYQSVAGRIGEDAMALLALAEAYIDLEQYEAAARAVDRARLLEPWNERVQAIGEFLADTSLLATGEPAVVVDETGEAYDMYEMDGDGRYPVEQQVYEDEIPVAATDDFNTGIADVDGVLAPAATAFVDADMRAETASAGGSAKWDGIVYEAPASLSDASTALDSAIARAEAAAIAEAILHASGEEMPSDVMTHETPVVTSFETPGVSLGEEPMATQNRAAPPAATPVTVTVRATVEPAAARSSAAYARPTVTTEPAGSSAPEASFASSTAAPKAGAAAVTVPVVKTPKNADGVYVTEEDLSAPLSQAVNDGGWVILATDTDGEWVPADGVVVTPPPANVTWFTPEGAAADNGSAKSVAPSSGSAVQSNAAADPANSLRPAPATMSQSGALRPAQPAVPQEYQTIRAPNLPASHGGRTGRLPMTRVTLPPALGVQPGGADDGYQDDYFTLERFGLDEIQQTEFNPLEFGYRNGAAPALAPAAQRPSESSVTSDGFNPDFGRDFDWNATPANPPTRETFLQIGQAVRSDNAYAMIPPPGTQAKQRHDGDMAKIPPAFSFTSDDSPIILASVMSPGTDGEDVRERNANVYRRQGGKRRPAEITENEPLSPRLVLDASVMVPPAGGAVPRTEVRLPMSSRGLGTADGYRHER